MSLENLQHLATGAPAHISHTSDAALTLQFIPKQKAIIVSYMVGWRYQKPPEGESKSRSRNSSSRRAIRMAYRPSAVDVSDSTSAAP